MTRDELSQNIKEQLQSLYGRRFRGLILYGSVARGDAGYDSDIDLLAVIEDMEDVGKEIWEITGATYKLQLGNLERLFHIMPVDAGEYETGAFALCREARRDGVAV